MNPVINHDIMTRKVEGKMNRNFSTKSVLALSVVVMFLWLAGNGCKGRTAETPPAPSAQISVSSRQIVNGTVVLNNILDQTVTVQNTGSARLTIGQIAQANPLAAPFSIVSDDCSGRTVQPSAACSFKVQFMPTNQGTFDDNFDIPSDASNENSVTVDVTGSGKALRVAINQVKTDSCSATGELELIVTVADQNNAPVTGLTSSNFQLQENGVTQPISSVSQELIPVLISVAMVLDYSGSLQNQVSTIEAASSYFLGLLNAGDEAAVIKFAENPQLMQDFTGDTGLLTTAVYTAPSSIGIAETHLYDALWFAVETTAVRQKTKAIVLLSDGKDENIKGVPDISTKTLAEVVAYAAENDVAIYTVGLGDTDGGVMSRLASETRGQYYYITDVNQLGDVYQAISDILFGQYSLKYVSSLQGGNPIMLEIDVVGGTDEGAGVLQTAGCP